MHERMVLDEEKQVRSCPNSLGYRQFLKTFCNRCYKTIEHLAAYAGGLAEIFFAYLPRDLLKELL